MDVAVKGVTDRVAAVSKETMSRGVSKATNKKGKNFAKKNEATAPEVIVCDDSGDDTGGGEGGTVVNSLGKTSRVNWARKDPEK